MRIVVYGQPAPQGSKRFVGLKAGRGIMIESSKAVKPWRQSVTSAALEARNGNPPLLGPIHVTMIFTLRKPSSAPKKRRTFPDRKPDLSKLVRSTEDALTDAGVWEDDARVVGCISRKVYTGDVEYGALDAPGALIEIRTELSL